MTVTFADLLSAIPATLPWLVILGMLALCWKLVSGQQSLLTLLTQSLAKSAPGNGATQPAPYVPPVAPPVVVPPVQQPPPVQVLPPFQVPALPASPKPTGPFADAPPWLLLALHDIGFHETGDNQGIGQFIAQAQCGAEGEPWCAIWMNAKLEVAGVRGTRSALAQSFTHDPGYVQIDKPSLGCIAVFWRNSRASGQGHVGMYWGENSTHVWVLGGNEDDMVAIEALQKDSASFGLLGYYWPRSVPLPSGGPVIMPAGSPVSIKVAPAGAPTVTAPVTAPAPAPLAMVDQGLVDAVKKFEGFSAKAFGDYKQYSIGYGTKAASPTEVITEAEAEKRLATELAIAAHSVEQFAPNAPVGVKQGLTDLTYNVGPVWEKENLGSLIKAGSYEEAKASVLQYNHAGGKVLAGLTQRREAEVSWFDTPL